MRSVLISLHAAFSFLFTILLASSMVAVVCIEPTTVRIIVVGSLIYLASIMGLHWLWS